VLWILPLAIALAGTALLAVLAFRVQHEFPPTQRALRRFGRQVKPAVVRVRDANARARNRFPHD
jgi:hypothetical protein